MLVNLKNLIDLKFNSQSEAAEAIFPEKRSGDSILSKLISSDPNTKFRRPTIDALKRVFPEYNIDWLLHSKGERFGANTQDVKTISNTIEDKDPLIAATPKEGNTRPIGGMSYPIEGTESPFIDLGDGKYIMVVPLVNEYAYAGYLSSFKDPEYLEELPKHTIIVDKHHKGQYRAFEVVGDSMDNNTNESIVDGTIVTGREIQRHLWTSKFHTHRFKDYIIVSKTEGIITKRISGQDVEKGIIVLHSLNPDKNLYPDFEMHLDDIQQMFNIVMVTQKR